MKTRYLLCAVLFCAASLAGFAQNTFEHPWAGKKVAYLGDSITDARNKESQTKYWGYLEKWLGISWQLSLAEWKTL